MTLVDTNVLLDIATNDREWFDWSAKAVMDAAAQGPLLVNAVIYAELSARYRRIEDVDEFIAQIGAQIVDISRVAAFLAAKAYAQYRIAGGTRTGVLPDFFIGAHALVLDIPVLTRDVGRYRTYFPHLRLKTPQLS